MRNKTLYSFSLAESAYSRTDSTWCQDQHKQGFYRYMQMNDQDALDVYSQANNLTKSAARMKHLKTKSR